MEKVILIGLQLPKTNRADIEYSLAELARLAETAGAVPLETIIQQRPQRDPSYFIGKGKAEEIKERAIRQAVKTLIFDDDLKPSQQKNLEEFLGLKIIDRTRLILDIFAQRARSKEGILQVERAQLAYLLPRITERFGRFEQQTGGIGARGPGEKKLEVDQRRIRERLVALDDDIELIRKHRMLLRQKRSASGQTVIAIVGYTNAGKSTLLNTLSRGHEVYADDKLFATLDPTIRQVKLPGGRLALFTDTVGFINKLPHTLVAAFRATLEEINQANCIVHVIDISHPAYEKHMMTVAKVLEDLDAEDIPVLAVYNKADRLPKAQRTALTRKGFLLVSAKNGEGLKELLARVESIITPKMVPHQLVVPYHRTNIIATLFKWSVVKRQRYTDKGVRISLESTPDSWKKIEALIKAGSRRP